MLRYAKKQFLLVFLLHGDLHGAGLQALSYLALTLLTLQCHLSTSLPWFRSPFAKTQDKKGLGTAQSPEVAQKPHTQLSPSTLKSVKLKKLFCSLEGPNFLSYHPS